MSGRGEGKTNPLCGCERRLRLEVSRNVKFPECRDVKPQLLKAAPALCWALDASLVVQGACQSRAELGPCSVPRALDGFIDNGD